MNTHLLTGLACIGGAFLLQQVRTVDIQAFPTVSTQPPVEQSASYSAAQTLSGYPVIGTPEQIKLAQQADWLVEKFDQDVYGADTPLPSQMKMVDGLYDPRGRKLNGVVMLPTKFVQLEAQRELRDIAATLFHERLHIAGHDHDFIYPVQDKFTTLLIQQGY